MGARRATRQKRLRLPSLFTPDPLRPGRHTAARQAKARAKAPEPAPTPPPVPRRRTPPGRRVTPLTDRPNDRGARARFAGVGEGEQRVAAGKYDRAQRAELRAQSEAAGGKVTGHTRGAPARKTAPGSARSRFPGRATPAELNEQARRAVPKPSTPARGVARRAPTPLPGDAAKQSTARQRQAKMTGADYAGTQHMPSRRTVGDRFFGKNPPTRYAAGTSTTGRSVGRPPQ